MNSEYIKKILQKNNVIFLHLSSVNSTMQEIKKIRKNKNIFLIADEQKNGIGRRGNSWESPPGNIYFSISLKYDLNLKDHFIYNAAIVLSIVNVLNTISNDDIKIKWPNDILINFKKISGVMSEIYQKNQINYINIGVGINFISSPKLNEYKTTHVYEINNTIDKNKLIYDIVKNFFSQINLIHNEKFDIIINDFKSKLLYLGKKINLEHENKSKISGIFEDINNDGSILLNINGLKHNIYSAR